MSVEVLIISGTIGAGKTAVLYECTDILAARGEPYAAVELDAFAMVSVEDPDERHAFAFENLGAVWPNFARRGMSRLLVGAAVESREHLAQYEAAIPGADITVCLLEAAPATIEQRLRDREVGSALEWHLERSKELSVALRAVAVHDFVVRNDDESVVSVATEVLRRFGLII